MINIQIIFEIKRHNFRSGEKAKYGFSHEATRERIEQNIKLQSQMSHAFSCLNNLKQDRIMDVCVV